MLGKEVDLEEFMIKFFFQEMNILQAKNEFDKSPLVRIEIMLDQSQKKALDQGILQLLIQDHVANQNIFVFTEIREVLGQMNRDGVAILKGEKMNLKLNTKIKGQIFNRLNIQYKLLSEEIMKQVIQGEFIQV